GATKWWSSRRHAKTQSHSSSSAGSPANELLAVAVAVRPLLARAAGGTGCGSESTHGRRRLEGRRCRPVLPSAPPRPAARLGGVRAVRARVLRRGRRRVRGNRRGGYERRRRPDLDSGRAAAAEQRLHASTPPTSAPRRSRFFHVSASCSRPRPTPP